ncbi:hypothetical protein PRIPAC_75220 [Pristionchus pacificus]|uniref:mitochondrial intermediate peptidase n=1 Tax=Pristionchus pacificus TaxID=54126 RepID=A0A8R1V5M3_PRIPA|nr:hypothetical protein PRIPAC_75220 [Pristionchus pacificus]
MISSSRRLFASSILSTARGLIGKGKQTGQDKVTGLFGNDLLKTAQGFAALTEQVKAKCGPLLERIEKGDKERTRVQLVDDLSNELCIAADLAECVRNLHSEPEMAKAAEMAIRELYTLLETLNTYQPLYENLKLSKETEKERLNEVDLRTLDLLVEEFEQSGVHLPDKEREEFVKISGEIFDAGVTFESGCDRNVEVGKSEKATFKLDSRLVSPVSHSSSRDKRKYVYNQFMKHSDEQESSLRKLITARHSLAKLTGFESYAHRSQKNSLLGSYENAHDFLWGLIQRIRPSAERELAVLSDVLHQCDHKSTRVGEWDLFYLTEMYKKSAFGSVPSSVLTQFVTLGNVLRGFGRITQSLYGVTFEQRIPLSGEMWEGAILKLLETGIWQSPVIVLSLNLIPQPNGASISSIPITMKAAENIFHELGHAMHSFLGRTIHQHVSGTRCPTDHAEIPSTLMEYFFYDINVMQKTLCTTDGKSIDIKDAATASYALFDLELHSPQVSESFINGKVSSTQILNRILSRALPNVERDEWTAYQHRFHHLIPYGSKYYSYLVAKASASLIWRNHFHADPYNREAGEKWAEAQSHGGGLPSSVILSRMLGSPPTPSLLIDTLASQSQQASNIPVVNNLIVSML